jgi:hypothetical protein
MPSFLDLCILFCLTSRIVSFARHQVKGSTLRGHDVFCAVHLPAQDPGGRRIED